MSTLVDCWTLQHQEEATSYLDNYHSLGYFIGQWSSIIAYAASLYVEMGRQRCTGNRKWKVYTALHLLAFCEWGCNCGSSPSWSACCIESGTPCSDICGKYYNAFGSFVVSRANGWSPFSKEKNNDSSFSTILSSEKEGRQTGRDWDISYTLASIAAGSILSYGSLYLAVWGSFLELIRQIYNSEKQKGNCMAKIQQQLKWNKASSKWH